MAGIIEYPDIKYVVYPVHLDGRPTGANPRMRHHSDCGHFEWGDGTILGTPKLATQEQLQTLRACKHCVGANGRSSISGQHSGRDGKLGEICPGCSQAMPLTGICDNCISLSSSASRINKGCRWSYFRSCRLNG